MEPTIALVNDVTIIIPAFNEDPVIGEVLQAIQAKLPGAEIIVVDDGSTDQTGVIARSLGVRVICHYRNLGYGMCLKTGIHASARTHVLFCDADGQHSADDVERVLDAACAEGADMVVGMRRKNSYSSPFRMPGKFILRKFANYLAGQKIPDLNSGLRIIRREVILRYLHLMPDGFSFSTTSTFALLKAKHRIVWLPITVSRRTGKSTVRQLRHGSQALMLMLRLTVLFEPLKVFLQASGVFFLLTIASFSEDMYYTWSKPHISSTTILCAIATMLVFLVGLICDQVSAIRREIHA